MYIKWLKTRKRRGMRLGQLTSERHDLQVRSLNKLITEQDDIQLRSLNKLNTVCNFYLKDNLTHVCCTCT